jgi:hypothetical protein
LSTARRASSASVPGANLELCPNLERGELRDALDTIERAGHRAGQRSPLEFRRRRDRAKGQDETVADGCDEQGFRRPLIAGTAEFCG